MSHLKTDPALGHTFVIALPTSWWLVQHAFASQFPDWNHDVRFFDAYMFPATFFNWLYEKTGWWGGQSYWVGIQDGVIGFVAAFAVTHLLVRRAAWHNHEAIRGLAALAGTLLPWYPFLLYMSLPDYYKVGVYSLGVTYLVAVLAAFLLRVSRGVRIALLILGILIGGAFVIWRFDLWDWPFWASLLAPLALLLQSIRRLSRNESVV